jgi:hypothetical protein
MFFMETSRADALDFAFFFALIGVLSAGSASIARTMNAAGIDDHASVNGEMTVRSDPASQARSAPSPSAGI